MPVSFNNDIFSLETKSTSYFLRVTKFGHLENLHYGERIPVEDAEIRKVNHTLPYGSSVMYDESDGFYCLDDMCLDWSGIGKGDYRYSPCEIKMPDGSFLTDFRYVSHEIIDGCVPMQCLPSAYDGSGEHSAQTLKILLRDDSAVELELYYTVFPENDVISRRAVVINRAEKDISIRKIMSMTIDLPERSYVMHTFDGGWSREAHHHTRDVQYGLYINSSSTGASSNRHNPGFLLSEKNAGEDYGRCWGFNLVYSGNHCGAVERSEKELVRIALGINPHCFDWTLHPGESFETPEAVMSFSNEGFNGLSGHFHGFVNSNIVRGDWKNIERPILLNNWEAHFFKFTRGKLVRLCRGAKKLGAELFVLDDGWFGARNSDTAGLGDYNVNTKKLPGGLKALSEKVQSMGMKFGLWFEPEMVNEDSDLYRAHPEWAVTTPGRKPCKGRNQLVLDLTRPEVRDYIVENVSRTIDENGISYVKWDMNRHIADAFSPTIDNQGEFYHRYIMGLYNILSRIFHERPHILLESCSSGGNRFDLGMMCFSPQIWASDDTDPVERQKIQEGLSYLYPQSTWGAHVSCAPHQQTLRITPLSTRFNTAAFGCLGYELDLRHLTWMEKKEMREQIAWYKQHRRTFQYGKFTRAENLRDGRKVWQATLDGEAMVGDFITHSPAAEGYEWLPVRSLDPDAKYEFSTRKQYIHIKSLASLLKHILPVEPKPDGFLVRTVNKFYALPDGEQHFTAHGSSIMAGVALPNRFTGTGYFPKLRLISDSGSTMYQIKRIEEK